MVGMTSTAAMPAALPVVGLRGWLRWLLSCGVRGYLLVALILVQISVPLAAFMGEPPTRFGFQMYSAMGWTSVEIVDSDGAPIAFDHDTAVAGVLRPELDWTQRLPEHLCRTVPAAAAVTVRQPTDARTITCD